MSYANITNPANFQLQDFAQFGFRVITTDFIPVPGEQYRTLYVLQDAVVTATTQKGDDITSKAILAGTLLHGLFNSVSITSGRVLAYAAGRVTAEEIIALYEAYVIALGGTLENTQCAVDTINEDGVDFFADASLVMIPEGYATGVVYGQRPLTSDSQLTFTRASDATRVGPDGAIAVVGSNVPRIDYTGGGCGKLLLEPQRTNLVTYSEQFDNGVWSKSGATITANSTTSPDGNTNASTVTFTGGSQFLTQNCLTLGTNVTASVWLLGTAGETIQIACGGLDQLVTLTGSWQRFSVNRPNTTNTFVNINTFGGATARVVRIYGFQAEAGAYATSYIPTTAAAVTRLADSCSKTGISNLIGQTQGTLFAEVDLRNFDTSADQLIAQLFQDSNNRLGLAMYRSGSTNRIQFYQLFGGNVEVNINTLASAGVFKLAGAYKNNDYVFYVNGVQIGVDTTASVPTASSITLGIGNSGVAPLGNAVKQLLLFKTRLTNEQLQKLTSL